MAQAVQSTHRVMKEVLNQLDDITEEDIAVYAHQIGIHPETETDLLWIAKKGLATPLPEPWFPVEDDFGRIFYYNTVTQQSSWEHPLDPEFRALVQRERAKKHLLDQASHSSETKMSSKNSQKGLHSVKFDLEDEDYGDLDDFEDSFEATEDVTLENLSEADELVKQQRFKSGRTKDLSNPEDFRISLRVVKSLADKDDVESEHDESDPQQHSSTSDGEIEEIVEEELVSSEHKEELESDKVALTSEINDNLSAKDGEPGSQSEIEDDVSHKSTSLPKEAVRLKEEKAKIREQMELELEKFKEEMRAEHDNQKSKLLLKISEDLEAYRSEREEEIKAGIDETLDNLKHKLQAEHKEKVQSLKEELEDKYNQIKDELNIKYENEIQQMKVDLERQLQVVMEDNEKLLEAKTQELKDLLAAKQADLQLQIEEEKSRLLQDHVQNLQNFREELLNKEKMIKDSDSLKALESESQALQEQIEVQKTEIQSLMLQKKELEQSIIEKDGLYQQLKALRDEIEHEQSVLEELEREKVTLSTEIKNLKSTTVLKDVQSKDGELSACSNVPEIHIEDMSHVKHSSAHQKNDAVSSETATSNANLIPNMPDSARPEGVVPISPNESDIPVLKQCMSSFENHLRKLSQKLDRVLDVTQTQRPLPEGFISRSNSNIDSCYGSNCTYCTRKIPWSHISEGGGVNSGADGVENEDDGPSRLFRESLTFMDELPVVMNELTNIQKKMDNQFKKLMNSLKDNTVKTDCQEPQECFVSSNQIDRTLRMIRKRKKYLHQNHDLKHASKFPTRAKEHSKNTFNSKHPSVNQELDEDAKPGTSNENDNAHQAASSVSSVKDSSTSKSDSSDNLSDLSCSSLSDCVVEPTLPFLAPHHHGTSGIPLTATSTFGLSGKLGSVHSTSHHSYRKNPVLRKYAENTAHLTKEAEDLELIRSRVESALRPSHLDQTSAIHQTSLPWQVKPYHLGRYSCSLPSMVSAGYFENVQNDHQSVLKCLDRLNKDINSMFEQMSLTNEVPLHRSNYGGRVLLPPSSSQRSTFTFPSAGKDVLQLGSSSGASLGPEKGSFQKEFLHYMEPIYKLRQELRSVESKMCHKITNSR